MVRRLKDLEDAEEADIRYKAELIREKRQLIRNEAKMRKSLKNRAVIPRTAKAVKLSKMESHLESLGHDISRIAARAEEARGRSRSRAATADVDAMDVNRPMNAIERAKARGRSQSTNRRNDGVTDEAAATKAEKLAKLSQKKMNRNARQGEADRHQTGSLIKHLVSPSSIHLSNTIANVYIDCRKAWYRKDQPQVEESRSRLDWDSVVCLCFTHCRGAAGRKIMVGRSGWGWFLQIPTYTSVALLRAGVVMQSSCSNVGLFSCTRWML